jgi:hypothetical protein
MDARKYDEPSSPPPSYESIVKDNRWDYRSNQYSNQRYHEDRTPDFDKFVRRYESEHLS